jgi:hypothetical protein
MVTSTRLSETFRLHLIRLRTIAYHRLDGVALAEMREAIEDLADSLVEGWPTTVEVGLEAGRDEEIGSLLDDSEPILSGDRDNRRSA